jgi:hypothetical protein
MNDDRVSPLRRPVIPTIGSAQSAQAMEREMATETATIAHNRTLALRTAARQDATIVVARARERGGASPTSWSAFDADAVHLITDLLLKLQGQEPTPLDPSFQTRDDALAAARTGRIEEAMKRGVDGQQALEENSGRPESGSDS